MSMLLALLASGSGAGAVAPAPAPAGIPSARRKFAMGANTNMVFFCNSYYAEFAYPGIQKVAPLSDFFASKGMTPENYSVPGITWPVMVLTAQNTVNAFKPGKLNVLMVGETRNTTFNLGRTITDEQELVRLTRNCIAMIQWETFKKHGAYWDYVVLGGTFPTQSPLGEPDSQVIAGNEAMSRYDEFMRNADNLKSVGADIYVDYRKRAPETFEGNGITVKPGFMSQPGKTVLEEQEKHLVHPTNSARSTMARCIRDAIDEYSRQ
nr:MAG TPA: hypothetical protein [Caudoviricetes sp.]